MKSIFQEGCYQLRYALPLWFVRVLTGWWPDNRVAIRIRGWLASVFIKRCGSNFRLGRDVTLLSVHNLTVGDNCYFAKGVWLNALGGLVIEDEVTMGPYVVISTLAHCFKNGSVYGGGSRAAPVRIGRGSWLAAHAAVALGITVGKGVLVAANAVVVKDTPDNVMVGGVPAKVIGPVEELESDVASRFG